MVVADYCADRFVYPVVSAPELVSSAQQYCANKVDRFFKGAETVLSGKGKTAEQLLADIYGHLKLLMDRRILTNTTLLQEIKKTVDEIFPKSGITQNNTHGTNVAGDQNFNNTGSGHQINGQGSTVNFNKST